LTCSIELSSFWLSLTDRAIAQFDKEPL